MREDIMLVGKALDETTTTLAEMHSAGYEFHLTGSRYFGRATEDSDWDFFAQSSPSLVEWLDQHGFILLNKQMYDDDNTAMVFRCHNVDVQLQKNATLKCRVQEYLFETGLLTVYSRELRHDSARKSYAKRIWNLAYANFTT